MQASLPVFLISSIVALFSLSNVSADDTTAPVTFTTREDHQQMLRQLGITKLRPGPNGNPTAPNAANYDEAKANPYPDWPGTRYEAKAFREGRTPHYFTFHKQPA